MAESLRERRRRQTAAAIVAGALGLFEERGFEGTTIEQIAAAADISRRTFFRYFADKEELFFAEDERLLTVIDETLDSAPDGEPVLDLARRATRALAAHSVADPERRLARERLIAATPALQARRLAKTLRWEQAIAARLAARGLERAGGAARAQGRPGLLSGRLRALGPRPRPGPAGPGRRELRRPGRPDRLVEYWPQLRASGGMGRVPSWQSPRHLAATSRSRAGAREHQVAELLLAGVAIVLTMVILIGQMVGRPDPPPSRAAPPSTGPPVTSPGAGQPAANPPSARWLALGGARVEGAEPAGAGRRPGRFTATGPGDQGIALPGLGRCMPGRTYAATLLVRASRP